MTPVSKPQRDQLRERSEGICEVCGSAPATNCHHRKNKSQGGGNELSNLMHVCGSGTTGCHGWITENPAKSYRYGLSVRSYGNPAMAQVFRRGEWVLLTDDGDVQPARYDDTDPPWM